MARESYGERYLFRASYRFPHKGPMLPSFLLLGSNPYLCPDVSVSSHARVDLALRSEEVAISSTTLTSFPASGIAVFAKMVKLREFGLNLPSTSGVLTRRDWRVSIVISTGSS